MTKKTRFLLILLALAAVAGLGLVIFQRISEHNARAGAKSDGVVITVGVTALQVSTVDEILRFQGLVEGDPQVRVFSTASGKLQRVLVREGELVEKDQVLGELDRSQPGADFLPVPVRAPGKGVVTKLYTIDAGTWVSPDRPFAELANLDSVKVQVAVGQEPLEKMKVGQRAVFAGPGGSLEGQVASVPPFIDRETLTGSVLFRAPNPGRKLKVGQTVNLDVYTGRHNGFVVPVQTVVMGLGRASVFVAEEGKVREVLVKMGDAHEGQVEVTGQLKAGDQVVTSGSFKLYDGAAIKVGESGQ